MKKLLVPLTLLLLTTGCLKKETYQAVYLDPSGAATWIVMDRNVRDDEADSAEERRVPVDVRCGAYPTQLGMAAAGATNPRSRLLRDERPYWILTEGRYASVQQMAREILDVLCDDSAVSLTADPEATRLDLECLPAEEPRMENDDPRWWLLAADGPFEIRLTRGRFVDAVGFEIFDDAQAARLVQEEDEETAEPELARVHWSLTWTDRP